MSLINDIKSDVKKAGSNKSKILYFRKDTKIRIRFLQDMDEGFKILFHDGYSQGIMVPCQEAFGKDCKYCGDETLKHKEHYVWSVWDYEAKEVKLFKFPVSRCTPIPKLVGFYDTYGTLTDRDYVITRTGEKADTDYTVVPMDKVKFKNEKATPLSEKAALKIIDKANPIDDEEDEEEDEDEKPKKKKGKPVEEDEDDEPKKKKGKKSEPEDDEDDEDDEPKKKKGKKSKYDDMEPRELYTECKERGIEVKPKKDAEYYIKALEADDAGENEDDDDEDSDW